MTRLFVLALMIGLALGANAHAQAALTASRTLSSGEALSGQAVSVTVTLRNPGSEARPYTLSETLTAGLTLVDGQTTWHGTLAAGATATHHYTVVVGEDAPTLLSWPGMLTSGPTETEVSAPLLVHVTVTGSLETPETAYVGAPVTLRGTLRNPLSTPLELTLTPVLSGTLRLLGGPTTLRLAAGEEASLHYTVANDQATLDLFQLSPSITGVAGVTVGSPLRVGVRTHERPTLPEASLTTTLSYRVSADGVTPLHGLVFALHLPEGAVYLAGSSHPHADPRVVSATDGAGSTLLYDLPASGGELALALSLEDDSLLGRVRSSLIALTPAPELLRGEAGVIALLELADITPHDAAPRERVGAVITEPAAGTVYSDRDAITVRTDTPLGSSVVLYSGDRVVAESSVGLRSLDHGAERQTLEYLGVPLVVGPNVLRLVATLASGETLEDTLTVAFAGPAARLEVVPLVPLTANAATPLLLELRFSDAFGNTPMDDLVTLEVEGTQPLSEDAAPAAFGYQRRVEAGRAELALRAPATPRTITVTARLAGGPVGQTLLVRSEQRPFLVTGVGSAGVTLSPGEGLHFGFSANLFARGSLSRDTLLTFALRAPLAPLSGYGNPYRSFALPGASGEPNQDAKSRAGVFVRLERDLSYLQLGDFVTPLSGTLLAQGRDYTGFSFAARSALGGPFAQGYAALAPVGREVRELELPSDGTSLYRLPRRPLEPGSLRAEVIKRSAFDRGPVTDDGDPLVEVLEPLLDYNLDEGLGLVRLSRALPQRDERGNVYLLRVSYRLLDAGDNSSALQFGLQVGYQFDSAELRLGGYQEHQGDRVTTVAAAGVSGEQALAEGTLRGDLEVAVGGDEGGHGVAIGAGAHYQGEGTQAQLRYSYRSENYPGGNTPGGHSAEASASVTLSPALQLGAGAAIGQQGGVTESKLEALGTYRTGELSGVASRGELNFGLQLANALPRAVAGVSLQDAFGLAGTRFSVLHRQGLAGASSVSDVTVGVRLLDNLQLQLTNRLEWGVGNALLLGLVTDIRHSDLFGAAADFGSSQLRAQYELAGGVPGSAGRVRLGLSSSLPLGSGVSVEFSADQALGQGGSATVLASAVRYQREHSDTTARLETRLSDGGPKIVFGLGTTVSDLRALYGGVQSEFIHDPAALTDKGTATGVRLNLAFAYRGEPFIVLADNTFSTGALDPDGDVRLGGDLRFQLRLSHAWDARAGYRYQYRAASGYQDVFTLGSGVAAWSGGNLSGYGRLFRSVRTGDSALGVTLEASQQLGCGLYGTLGYSAGGTSDPVFGRNGLQLRLDVVADEQWRCGHAEGQR